MRLAPFALLALAAACHTPPMSAERIAEASDSDLINEVQYGSKEPGYKDRVIDELARRNGWSEQHATMVRARKIWIGAGLVATLTALGRPRKWDTTHVAGGRIDYLFYGDPLRGGKLVTLRNGIVQSWSTH